MLVTQQLDDLQVTREIAMEALDVRQEPSSDYLFTDTSQSVIAKMHSALEYGTDRYQKLYAKYRELEDTVANNATHVTKQVEDVPGYVLAIIDAHSHNLSLWNIDTKAEANHANKFMDPFLKGASDDGTAAAKRVEEIIAEFLRLDHPDLAGLRVLIRVYADVKLLSSQLDCSQDGNGTKHSESLRSFIQKFSSASPFSDFIDITYGSGLEEKMKGTSTQSCGEVLMSDHS